MFNELHVFLANIWFFIIWLIFFLYIVVDGFDLGVGILFLLNRDDKQRTIMMASLGSIWDANETWLVLLIGALFGAFPLVYAIVLHALYIPVMLMIFALIFRGVAFEFRSHAHNKVLWNMAFGGGSLLAAIAQGLAFGGLVSGLNVTGTGFEGGWAWLSPFSLLVAVGVVVGYGLWVTGSDLFNNKNGRRFATNQYPPRLCYRHSRYIDWYNRHHLDATV